MKNRFPLFLILFLSTHCFSQELSKADRIEFAKAINAERSVNANSDTITMKLMKEVFSDTSTEEYIRSGFDSLAVNDEIFDRYIYQMVMYERADKEKTMKLFNYIVRNKSLAEKTYGYITTQSRYKDSIDAFLFIVKNSFRPSFIGGEKTWRKFLATKLNNSVPVDKGAPAGRYVVTVSFLIDTTGKVTEVKALNDPGYGTAKEAERAIKSSPKWNPATRVGQKVTYRQRQQIIFTVEDTRPVTDPFPPSLIGSPTMGTMQGNRFY